MANANRPLPSVKTLDKPYWDYARQHELRLQQCTNCHAFRYPVSPICAECSSAGYDWNPVSGHGEVLSWVVFHRCYFEAFRNRIPYNVALVKLAEGPVMATNILNVSNDAIHKGMRVTVVFEEASPEITLPQFEPART